MSARAEQLARRREHLLGRSESQRAQLAYYYGQFHGPMQAAEVVLHFTRGIRRSPLFVTGFTALLLKTPWRRLARWPKTVWRGWRILQFVRSWKR